jgi:23S rRNA (adenine2503-C2)-methyltransferase
MSKEPLFGKTLEELKQIAIQADLPAFASLQLAQWLYKKNVQNINEITNFSKKTREALSEKYEIGISHPINEQKSKDGTKKYLFSVRNGNFIESAYLPENNRNTLCVSSQSGCKMNCIFFMTGKLCFNSNLTAGEIINQISNIPENKTLTNVVYMGMGEPLDNYDEVLKSIKILTSDWGYGWSPRRINLSTIGIIPALKRIIEETDVHIAISLHSPFHEERKTLIPIEEKYPITEVVKTIREYDFGRQRRLSFEYILFKDLNDTPQHIKGITKLLNGLRCRINLIKFHSVSGVSLLGCSHEKSEWFAEQLNNKNFTTTIRRSRGEDIKAACGQLAGNNLKI